MNIALFRHPHLLLAALFVLISPGRGEILSQYNMGPNGSTPGSGVPTTVGLNVSATTMAAGSGMALDYTSPATQPTSTPYLRTTFTAVGGTPALAITNNAYFNFTVTANAGYVLNLTSLNFDAMRGGAGTPRGYVVRSSVDGFSANLAQSDIGTARPTFTNVNVDLSAAAFQNLPTITFRIYSYSSATTSSVDFDSFTVNGTAQSPASTYLWTGSTNGNWNTTTANWTGAGSLFSDGVVVGFNDSAPGTANVTVVPSLVSPFAMGIDASSKSYSFAGGAVAVTSGLTKGGTETATINNSITAAYGTVNNGTLAIGTSGLLTAPVLTVNSPGNITVAAGGALGASTGMIVNGAFTLNNGTQTVATLGDSSTAGVTTLNATALTVTGTSTYNGKLTGNGSVVKTTGGILTLAGTTNDFTGGTTISGGSLRINNATATGTGVVRVEPAGTLILGSDAALSVPITLAGGTIGATGAARTLNGDLTVENATISTLACHDPQNPATSMETVLLGVLHGTGTLNITAATGQGDPNGGGGIRFRNVTTASDFTGIINIANGAKLEIRSAGGSLNAAGTGSTLRLAGGTSGLTTAAGTYSQINLRTDVDAVYGNNVTLTGTGFVNIFAGPITGTIIDRTVTMGTLTIGDQQILAANSGSSVSGFKLVYSAVQLTGGIAGFSPGNVFATVGQEVSLGPITELAAASGFAKSGVSPLNLTAANSYTGPTSISAGTLRLGAAGALPATTALTVDGGIIDLNLAGVSNSQTVASLAGTGGIITNSDTANVRTLTVSQAGTTSFAGSINDAISLTKAGNGTLTLSGVNTYSGATAVDGGTLCVTGTVDNTTSLSVASGATFCAMDPHTVTLNGTITNNGTIRVSNGAHLEAAAAASFVNNGILDLISGTANLPANFTNGPGGIVVDASSVKVKTLNHATNTSTFTLTIDSYTGHSYQLKYSANLSDGFTPLGAPQQGVTGTTLTFTDPGATPGRGFYKIVVD